LKNDGFLPSAEILRLLDSILEKMIASSELWSGLFGAVLGAVIGGIISYILQNKALKEARKFRDEDHLRSQQALANSVLFKLSRIHANFAAALRHLDECTQEANATGEKLEPWQFVVAVANPPDAIKFSADEMGMIIGLQSDELFNRLSDIEIVHESLTKVILQSNSERESLGSFLKADISQGRMVSGTLTSEEFVRVRPLQINLNTLIEVWHELTKKHMPLSWEAIQLAQNQFRSKLKIKFRIEPKVVN
jgi:hypothetical protein